VEWASGYEATAEYFQFAREIGESGREVEIDLLTAPPADEHADAVKQSAFRTRPCESEGIHGRVAEEAQSIDRNAIPVDLSSTADRHGVDFEDPIIYIPSRFNYLILKLHAFSDRKDDANADHGHHHAMDIFTTVTDMSKSDWQDAEQHFNEECDETYLKEAIDIQRRHFGNGDDLGILRIQENEADQRYEAEFDKHLPEIVEDLNDLFSGR
jgi:hypothetical protein